MLVCSNMIQLPLEAEEAAASYIWWVKGWVV